MRVMNFLFISGEEGVVEECGERKLWLYFCARLHGKFHLASFAANWINSLDIRDVYLRPRWKFPATCCELRGA